MVSPAARPYIDASVPVLREHGVTITRTFYSNMFEAHPELRNLFNMGNQASGVQQQSLAGAVFAYAANIDNLAALTPVVTRIVHKHVSVGIKPEHYPIVGKYLLGAIEQTLGDAASPPLLEAWAEAYNDLANIFINAERDMYEQAGVGAGELHEMRVTKVEQQSANITAFTLLPADGKAVPDFKPGQYVSVSVNLTPEHRQIRQYSLSDAPNGTSLRISVKREDAMNGTPQGEVSNWLHLHVQVGSVLQVSHPFGEFAPDTTSSAPILLLSAGVGITPMISTLNHLAKVQPQRQVIFAHAVTNVQHHSHQADIAAAMALMPNLQVVNFYGEGADESAAVVPGNPVTHRGFMVLDKLPAWPHSEADVYMCGSTGFLTAQWQALLAMGVPVTRLHREVFGPELLHALA